jgi:hypothetical protein
VRAFAQPCAEFRHDQDEPVNSQDSIATGLLVDRNNGGKAAMGPAYVSSIVIVQYSDFQNDGPPLH